MAHMAITTSVHINGKPKATVNLHQTPGHGWVDVESDYVCLTLHLDLEAAVNLQRAIGTLAEAMMDQMDDLAADPIACDDLMDPTAPPHPAA